MAETIKSLAVRVAHTSAADHHYKAATIHRKVAEHLINNDQIRAAELSESAYEQSVTAHDSSTSARHSSKSLS